MLLGMFVNSLFYLAKVSFLQDMLLGMFVILQKLGFFVCCLAKARFLQDMLLGMFVFCFCFCFFCFFLFFFFVFVCNHFAQHLVPRQAF
jgi:hypothetical protein